jgi:tRNA modification GTPase trmE
LEQTQLIMQHTDSERTIAAIATPAGQGGIAVIRVSGRDAFDIVQKMWRGKPLAQCTSHTAHLGNILQEDGSVLDQAVITLFRGPNSFTGEDTVEISVHGSRWIQREALNQLMRCGAKPAGPGEFSQRAFANGRMDLAQTEAVADLIAAESRAAHRLALSQMSGAFSRKLNELREQLIHFGSLLELELDFSEEDVEFADRTQLINSAKETLAVVQRLALSYKSGRAFKEGVPVAIAGAPNVGKSTLLNRLLDCDKAIVSDIPGTTRDIIEDTREIGGILFRFIDTAGLRDTADTVERIGIERAKEHIDRATVTLWLVDPTQPLDDAQLASIRTSSEGKRFVILTKSDLSDDAVTDRILAALPEGCPVVSISAKTGLGIDKLETELVRMATAEHDPENELIVTNARHYEALTAGAESLQRVLTGLQTGIPTDFVAQDVREALYHLGLVTGAVTTADLLTSIFSHFCIGK